MTAIPRTLVCLGDSITQGHTMSNMANAWPNQLQLALGAWYVINQGIAGQTTAEMLARFENDVVKAFDPTRTPSYVMIMGGTNDITGMISQIPGYSMSNTEANLASMVTLAQENGIIPILNTIAPYGNDMADTAILNAWINNYVTTNDILSVDVFSIWQDPDDPGNFNPLYAYNPWGDEYPESVFEHPNDAGCIYLVSQMNLSTLFGNYQTNGYADITTAEQIFLKHKISFL